MRSFRYAAGAAVMLASTMFAPVQLLAEQTPKSAHRHAKPNSSQTIPIEVISGPSKRTVYVHPMPPPEQTPANAVVIYNGNQKQTRFFNASTDPSAPVPNLTPAVIAVATAGSKSDSAKPVVVGISSNGPDRQPVVVHVAASGSSTQPVVLGVASSGFQTTGAVEPVATAVSPRPAKRPPYRPSALDRQ